MHLRRCATTRTLSNTRHLVPPRLHKIIMNYCANILENLRYAGIAVPQVLQYLREFDAPAMQSCKPLPCGIGSCQNRRLREQTLNRKPCHCGSIKGGWCMELPTSLDQPLQGQIVCACLDMFLPV